MVNDLQHMINDIDGIALVVTNLVRGKFSIIDALPIENCELPDGFPEGSGSW